jgi:hypothetical protein
MATLKLHQRRRRPRLGPYSKPHALTGIDGRCRVARAVREFARELVVHIGEPTAAQRVLIREASIKNAKLGLLVDQILEGTAPDLDMATRCYLAWSNSLRRDLEALGLKGPEKKLPELGQFLALRRGPGRPPKVA